MPIRSQLGFAKTFAPVMIAGLSADAARKVARRVRPTRIPSGVAITDFDPLNDEMASDPYRYYPELLAGPAVHYNQRRDIYILCRHEDVRAGARASDVLSSAEGIAYSRVRADSLLTMDPPKHTAMRKQAQPAFTRGALQSWQDMVEKLCIDYTATLFAGESVDIVKTLAEPLPTAVIAHILGIGDDDWAAFKEWSNEAVRLTSLDLSRAGLRQAMGGVRAVSQFHAYFTGKLERGELLDEDTVLGKLVANAHDGRLSNDELFFFSMSLLLAGNETTTNMLGTLFLTLSDNPDQLRLLQERPDLIPSAIEEQLRFYSPIQGLYRTARADYVVDNVTIPAGSRVLLLWGAANRDPRQYENPEEFRVERNPTGHVAFGSGVHLCLGAHLARLEGHTVLREIVNNVGSIEILGTPGWRTNPTLRGLEKLTVRVTRRDAAKQDIEAAPAPV